MGMFNFCFLHIRDFTNFDSVFFLSATKFSEIFVTSNICIPMSAKRNQWSLKFGEQNISIENWKQSKRRLKNSVNDLGLYMKPLKKFLIFFSFQASVSKFSKRQQLTDFYCNVISFLFACFAMFFTSFRRNKLKEIIS